jgi:hypothetical protein
VETCQFTRHSKCSWESSNSFRGCLVRHNELKRGWHSERSMFVGDAFYHYVLRFHWPDEPIKTASSKQALYHWPNQSSIISFPQFLAHPPVRNPIEPSNTFINHPTSIVGRNRAEWHRPVSQFGKCYGETWRATIRPGELVKRGLNGNEQTQNRFNLPIVIAICELIRPPDETMCKAAIAAIRLLPTLFSARKRQSAWLRTIVRGNRIDI